MKKFFTLVAATMFAALSLISMKSYGSHAVGADVTYTYVGPNQYLVTARFYRARVGLGIIECIRGISTDQQIVEMFDDVCVPEVLGITDN